MSDEPTPEGQPPKPCAPSRLSFLEMIRLNEDVEDLKEIRQIALEGLSESARQEEMNGDNYRALEQRIKELEEQSNDATD